MTPAIVYAGMLCHYGKPPTAVYAFEPPPHIGKFEIDQLNPVWYHLIEQVEAALS